MICLGFANPAAKGGVADDGDHVAEFGTEVTPELNEPGFFGGGGEDSTRQPRTKDAVLFFQKDHLPSEFLLGERGQEHEQRVEEVHRSCAASVGAASVQKSSMHR